MTINNKSERNYRGKCLGWPVTSYGGGVYLLTSTRNLETNLVSRVSHLADFLERK